MPHVILDIALIGLLGIGAQWVAWRTQLPAIVLLLAAGFLAGPITGVLRPEETFGDLLSPFVTMAVAIILFEGGLNLQLSEIRETSTTVRRVILFGAPITWGLTFLAAHHVAGLSVPTAAVISGILVVTGPTVIMPLLRQSKLGGRTGAFLKWEGIVNDPIGALFAVAAFEIIRVAATGESILGKGAMIVVAAAIGVGMGIAFGWGIVRSFRQGWTPEYLKAPIIFSSIILCYALAEQVEKEIGLVAVTAYGMTLANSRLAGLNELRKFKEDIAVLLVSGVFVILTANLTPEVIRQALTWKTLAFLLVMLLVVRPLSVWTSTWGTLKRNEALLLGWIAPRGVVAVAVSSLFATLLSDLGRQGDSKFSFSGADQITPLAFAVVFTTVVLHGFTIGPLARQLGLARKEKPGVLLVGVNPWSIDLARVLKDLNVEPILADNNWRRLRPAREAGLNTFFGEVLSEDAEMRLDHSAFDQVVGLSANEPYNALVSGHFAPELGRHRVYQLSAQESEEDDPRAIGMGTRGRTLIRRGRSYDSLVRDHYRGWVFSKTKLTDSYGLEQFRKDRPKVDIIAELRPDGTLNFIGPSREAKGGDGVTLISFGPQKEVAEVAADSSVQI